MTERPPAGALEAVLTEAQRRSLIGALPVSVQIAHSRAFLWALSREVLDGPVLELGSGGGLPGLVVAFEDPELEILLLDSTRRSTEFLHWAVGELRISSRTQVVNARAEQLGREPDYRGRFAAVVAQELRATSGYSGVRSPISPGRRPPYRVRAAPEGSGTTAAAVLPPVADRWPAAGCAKLGLTPEAVSTRPFRLRRAAADRSLSRPTILADLGSRRNGRSSSAVGPKAAGSVGRCPRQVSSSSARSSLLRSLTSSTCGTRSAC